MKTADETTSGAMGFIAGVVVDWEAAVMFAVVGLGATTGGIS